MKSLFSEILKVAILGSVLVVFQAVAFTEPTQSPPDGNVPAPLNVSSFGQSKSGGLILNTGGAATGLIVDKGSVGIGTQSPTQKLDVAGFVRGATGLCIGNDCRTAWPGGGGGPTFINPVIVCSYGAGDDSWQICRDGTYNASNVIPAGATAVILEAEGQIRGGFSSVDAIVKIRKDASSPYYILINTTSDGVPVEEDRRIFTIGNQGTFPITPARTFQYTVGAADSITIRLIGYY